MVQSARPQRKRKGLLRKCALEHVREVALRPSAKCSDKNRSLYPLLFCSAEKVGFWVYLGPKHPLRQRSTFGFHRKNGESLYRIAARGNAMWAAFSTGCAGCHCGSGHETSSSCVREREVGLSVDLPVSSRARSKSSTISSCCEPRAQRSLKL